MVIQCKLLRSHSADNVTYLSWQMIIHVRPLKTLLNPKCLTAIHKMQTALQGTKTHKFPDKNSKDIALVS